MHSISPVSACNRDVLPEPIGPIMATNYPFSISKLSTVRWNSLLSF